MPQSSQHPTTPTVTSMRELVGAYGELTGLVPEASRDRAHELLSAIVDFVDARATVKALDDAVNAIVNATGNELDANAKLIRGLLASEAGETS